jgi:hypothetical protein
MNGDITKAVITKAKQAAAGATGNGNGNTSTTQKKRRKVGELKPIITADTTAAGQIPESTNQ